MSKEIKTRKDGTIIKDEKISIKVEEPKVGMLLPLEEHKENLFDSYMKDFGLEGFCPFIKFKNFGDFVIGQLVKIDYGDVVKGVGVVDNMYLEVQESNITTINETSKRKGEIVETLVGTVIKFFIPTDVNQKLKAHNLIENKSIIGIKKLKESDFIRFGKAMIEFEVFVKNE